MGEKLSYIFLQLFCEKNSDGTKHLRLKGNELYQRIGTRLRNRDMYIISNFLKEHPEIISVDLAYNKIGDRGVKVLVEEYLMMEENTLEHINLMHCDIKAEGLKWLTSSENLKLKSCRLNGNKLGSAGSRYIASLIQNCPTLVHFDISETDQSLEDIECILIIFERSPLEVLDMSRIIQDSYYTKYNMAILADDLGALLHVNNTLRELHIQKCEFDGHDVEILLTGLRQNKTLHMLDLGCNRIGDLGAQLIANWLKKYRPPLRGLDISANNIKDFGARAISLGLPFSTIRYLDISNNHIRDGGITDLLDTIKKIFQMRLLYLWGNTFGQTSCKRITRMMQSGVLVQEYFDVQIYEVDGLLYAAFYPANHYKHKYYCVMDHGCPVELKIKRNKIPHPDAQPRELVHLTNVARYPPVDDSLGLKIRKEKECPEDEVPK